jgi:hypothetical protein
MKKRVQDAMEKQARQWELSGLDRMLLTELERSEYAQSVELYEKNVHEDPMSDSVWESLAHFTCELMWKRGLDPNEWMVAEDGRTIRQKTKRDKRQWSLSEDEREELARLLFNRDSKDRIDFAEEMGIGCRTDLPKNS